MSPVSINKDISTGNTNFGKAVISNIQVQNQIDESETWAVIITVGEQERDRNDVIALTEILVDSGWPENHILQIVEEEATKNAILTEPLIWLTEQMVNQNDIVLFYFSMHGDQTYDLSPLDEPDNLDEFLVPYDYDPYNNNTMLRDDELSQLFEQIKSDNIAIIFETCHSGGMVDGNTDIKENGRVILMSAATDETSGPLFVAKRWLFPFYLTKGLQGPADIDGDLCVTAEEAFTYAQPFTTFHSVTIWFFLFIHPFVKPHLQHPQLCDGYPSLTENAAELPLIFLDS